MRAARTGDAYGLVSRVVVVVEITGAGTAVVCSVVFVTLSALPHAVTAIVLAISPIPTRIRKDVVSFISAPSTL